MHSHNTSVFINQASAAVGERATPYPWRLPEGKKHKSSFMVSHAGARTPPACVFLKSKQRTTAPSVCDVAIG